MEPKGKRDYQTFSIFIILAFLTAMFVLGARVVLFAPLEPGRVPAQEAGKSLPAGH
jgi:hypothetical protein